MLDKLFDAIGGDVISNLTQKTGITTDQAKEVLPLAQESIQSGIMEQVKSGDISSILGMFNSGSGMSNNPIFGSIKSMFLSSIMSKLGLPSGIANMVAGSGLESIMGSLGGILKGDGDEVTQDGIMDKLDLGGGLGDMAKGLIKGKLGDITGGLFG